MESKYYIVKDWADVRKLVKCCKQTRYCSFDFETNAQPLWNKSFYPTILSISFEPGHGIAIPLDHFDSPFKGTKSKKILRYIGRKVIENPNITKLAWNWKFDQQIMRLYNIHSKGVVIDAMLAKYILDEERPHDLKSAVTRYLPQFSGYQNDIKFEKLPWDKKPLEPLAKYGCIDSDATLRLGLFFEAKLIEFGLYDLYRNLIMMASRVLMDVEREGITLDQELNNSLIKKYGDKIANLEKSLSQARKVKKFEKYYIQDRVDTFIEKLEDEIEELKLSDKKSAKRSIESRQMKIARILTKDPQTKAEKKLFEPINFASQKQMVDLLYLHPKGFRFPILKYTEKDKKPTNNPSTAEDVLKLLKPKDKSGFIETLLELRGIETIHSTFLVGWKELLQDDGKLHPGFWIHGTTSGRLSSRNPNGQNVPKVQVNPDVKPQLIPPTGWLSLTYDYSQAELRILAHLAKEKNMLLWFREGRDIHLASACKKYDVEYEDALAIYSDEQHPEYTIWKVRRKQAKTINFGVVYEQTKNKLSESLSEPDKGIVVTPDEAQVFLDDFFQMFPNIKKFMDRQHKRMDKKGYVTSLFGRRRRCPNVWSENYSKHLEALRQATNMPCQSAASDMALFSTVLIWEKIKLGEIPPIREYNTVHDSVYQYALPEYLTPKLIYDIWSICKNPDTKKYFGFSITDVEMSMDFGVGRNMAEELPYVPGYDYSKMLSPDFSKDEYYTEHKKVKDIPISEYPKYFKQYF